MREEHLRLTPALKVAVCGCDVATEAGRAALLAAVDALDEKPDLLINNAGVGDYGSVISADPARLRGQIELNITALVLLSQAMISRLRRSADRPAGILNVGSLASMLPMPDMAVYAASKSFVTSFSDALRVELAAEHIIVTCVNPGPTPTNFGKNARREGGVDTDRSGQELVRIPPEQVVREALGTLAAGRASVFPGLGVTFASILFRLLPRGVMRWLVERRFRRSRAAGSEA